MTVADVCRKNPCTATPDESVREAAVRMRDQGVGSLVVVDPEQRPVGMVTDRSLVVRVLRRRRDPDRTTLREVMDPDVVTVWEHAPSVMALRAMRREGVRRVPVVGDGGQLIGIVAADDALLSLTNTLDAVSGAVRSQLPSDLEESR